VLRELGVDLNDGVHALVADVAEAIEEPISVYPRNLRVPGYFSVLVRDPDLGYVIFVQKATSGEHQAHLILHELGHLLLGTMEPLSADISDLRATHRSGDYSDPAERDAEFLARVIGTWMGASMDAQLPEQMDPRAERLAAELDDRAAWP
jgi:Zn-dependent peptidase ImmA (M78 family)